MRVVQEQVVVKTLGNNAATCFSELTDEDSSQLIMLSTEWTYWKIMNYSRFNRHGFQLERPSSNGSGSRLCVLKKKNSMVLYSIL